MRRIADVAHSWGWGRYLIIPGLVWLVVMALLTAGLIGSQVRSERELQRRFQLRVSIAAGFAANHAADLLQRERVQAERFLSGQTVTGQRLTEIAAPFGYAAAVLLDDKGRLLQVVPPNPQLIGTDLTVRYEHLRTAVRDGVPVVSQVVPSVTDGTPVAAFAVPFDTPYGRRVFSGGLQVQESPLGSYLGHAIALPTSRAYLLDPDGRIVASDRSRTGSLDVSNGPLAAALARGGSGTYSSGGQEWFFGADPVAGTPWRIVAAVPAAVLYAPAHHPGLWQASLLAFVALGGLAGAFAAARGRRNRWRLRESEQRFRDIFDNSLIGMLIAAPAGTLIRVNPAFCAMLGYPRDEMLQRSFTELTHPDDIEATMALVRDALAGRIPGFSSEKRYLHATGRTVHVAVTTSLLRDHAGSPLHFATQVVDVTDRRNWEAVQEATNVALREAHQHVADLVGMLSHDVRQPLGVIAGYADIVLNDWDTITDGRRRDFLGRISAASRRMTILVEDILALTNLDAGTIQPRRATVDIGEAITEALAQLPDDDAAAVTVTQPVEPTHTIMDPGHLQQILLNLLGNAAKYGSAPIDVTVAEVHDRIDITVADHGDGVPEDFVPHLFERFTRANTGRAVAQKGTGLGLYIVAQLAHANHATVTYRRNRPSGGCFTVHVPAAEPADVARTERELRASRRG
ncbi:MAG TPA: PAS domain S-box protein [Micromonosporaceae bacterium]|nr:PAS domain S-box protein [Micromonosporaceae bacterium]